MVSLKSSGTEPSCIFNMGVYAEPSPVFVMKTSEVLPPISEMTRLVHHCNEYFGILLSIVHKDSRKIK